MRVALMVTCINDAMFPATGRAVVTLLRRLGVDVEFPEAQTCCAQPMVNTGYLDEAVPVVRTFVDAFAGYDAVVTPSGSCAGSARHQHGLVARRSGDAGLEDAVAELGPRVLAHVCDEMAAAQDQMVLLSSKNAEERVCSFLQKRLKRAIAEGALQKVVDAVDLPGSFVAVSASIGRGIAAKVKKTAGAPTYRHR